MKYEYQASNHIERIARQILMDDVIANQTRLVDAMLETRGYPYRPWSMVSNPPDPLGDIRTEDESPGAGLRWWLVTQWLATALEFIEAPVLRAQVGLWWAVPANNTRPEATEALQAVACVHSTGEVEQTLRRIANSEVLKDQTQIVQGILNPKRREHFDWSCVTNLSRSSEDYAEVRAEDIQQWWLVSPWLANELAVLGEAVIDGGSDHWWGRCNSNQPLLYDGTLQRVALQAIEDDTIDTAALPVGAVWSDE